MPIDEVRVQRDGAALVVTVDRAHVRNAVDLSVVDALERALAAAEADPAVRAIVVTGAGSSAFVSGGDLKFLATASTAEAAALRDRMRALLDRIGESHVVAIAAINGPAVGGGCELLVACDVRIAESHATFCFKQAALGLATGWDASSRLPALVSRGAASRLLFTAMTIDAAEALRIGLTDELVAADHARARAVALAEEIATNSGASVAALKRNLQAAYGMDRDAARAVERASWDDVASQTYAARVRGQR